jgi:AAA15 family ATPase/GTPase
MTRTKLIIYLYYNIKFLYKTSIPSILALIFIATARFYILQPSIHEQYQIRVSKEYPIKPGTGTKDSTNKASTLSSNFSSTLLTSVFKRISEDDEIACRHFDLPVFDPELMSYFKDLPPLNCENNEQWVTIDKPGQGQIGN